MWLAPPSSTPYMYPYPPPLKQNNNSATNTHEPSMSNTSRVDVFAPCNTDFPDFEEHVTHEAMVAHLEPGDTLFFPPGWWHAMKSDDTSLSVSMWY